MNGGNRVADSPQSSADNRIPACLCHPVNPEARLPDIMDSRFSFLPQLIDPEAFPDRFLIGGIKNQPISLSVWAASSNAYLHNAA
jgi:hypothetical protein